MCQFCGCSMGRLVERPAKRGEVGETLAGNGTEMAALGLVASKSVRPGPSRATASKLKNIAEERTEAGAR